MDQDQVPLASRKRRVARHFSVEDKERILNIFKDYDRENSERPKTEVVEFTAKTAGVSVTSVFKILREYKKTHELHPPKVYRRQRTVLDNIDEGTKSTLKRLLHSFLERNEPPTLDKVLAAVHEDERLPQLKRTTLWTLIKEVGFSLQPSQSTSTSIANPFFGLKEPSCSLPSLASKSTPLTTDPFIKLEEPSCSDIQEPETTSELLPQLSEQPVLNAAVKQKPTYKGCKDTIYCRLCLKPTNKDSLTPLNVIDINYPGKSDAFKKKIADEMKEIQKMIKVCLPFFDSLTFNPIICSICLTRLRSSYEFANECLKNQRLIKKYVDVYGITEKVVNINEIIESKFRLSSDRTSDIDAEVPAPNIPKVSKKGKSRVTQQMKGEDYLRDGPVTKRQKMYNKSHEEDPLTSLNEDAPSSKTKSCEDGGYASKEFLRDIHIREINPDSEAEESMIKIEPDYIDSPVYVKPELVDDEQAENKMFNKGMGFETDIQEQQSDSYGIKNVTLDETNVLSFTTGSVISNEYFILETVPSPDDKYFTLTN